MMIVSDIIKQSRCFLAILMVAAAIGPTWADDKPAKEEVSAKDIVLATLEGNSTGYDGLKVTVIGINRDGTTQERSPQQPFSTGERFRIRLMPTSGGMLTLTNTSSQGEQKVLLTQQIKKGGEVILPSASDSAFEFRGSKGVERLDLVLVPSTVSDSGGASAAKDIRLVTQDTADAGYLMRPAGSGPLTVTLTIIHQ